LSTMFKILSNNLLSRFSSYAEEIIEVLQCGFRRNDQLLIICSAFVKYLRGKKWEYNEAVHQLFIDFKKGNDSVRREVLCNVLMEFGIIMKLVRIIKMCLDKTCNRVQAGKHLSDMLHITNGLKQGDALSRLLFNFALDTPLGRFR